MALTDAPALVLPIFPDGFRLRTARLVLRPPTIDDVDSLWPHVTDSRVTRFLAWNPHPDKGVTENMLRSLIEAQQEGKGFHWMVTREEEVIGIVSLIDVRRTHRSWTLNRAELAYWLGPDFQGAGFATEAAQSVLQFAYDNLALHKIIVYHVTENPPSGAVAQRLGFRHVGEELDAFKKGDRWYHFTHYELLDREFSSPGVTT